MLLVASFMTFLMGMLSISQIDTPYQLQIVQTSLLVIHAGVVIAVVDCNGGLDCNCDY